MTGKPDHRAPRLRRRSLLLGGVAAVGGGTALAGCAADGAQVPTSPGRASVPFHGAHQAGIDTLPAQAHVVFLALDLRPGSGVHDVRRLMRLLTDDAARLTSGQPPLGVEDRELAALPSRLTVTFGFGTGVFDAVGRPEECPEIVRNLPAFRTDRLDPRWSGGDLLVQVCADDLIPLSYALRRLVRDARGIATVRWTQRGFNPASGSEPAGTTPRNLMGQRDGTANPAAGSPQLADVVWIKDGPPGLVGGSMLVLRRIRIDLDAWDDLARDGREIALARRLDTGAPVTGGAERDRPNLTMLDPNGVPVVLGAAHVARASARDPAERMLRRGFSYDAGPAPDGTPDAGLLFAAYQANAAAAFVPVQQRLAESDALSQWITHVGSATFVIPAGCAPGEFVAQRLIGP